MGKLVHLISALKNLNKNNHLAWKRTLCSSKPYPTFKILHKHNEDYFCINRNFFIINLLKKITCCIHLHRRLQLAFKSILVTTTWKNFFFLVVVGRSGVAFYSWDIDSAMHPRLLASHSHYKQYLILTFLQACVPEPDKFLLQALPLIHCTCIIFVLPEFSLLQHGIQFRPVNTVPLKKYAN